MGTSRLIVTSVVFFFFLCSFPNKEILSAAILDLEVREIYGIEWKNFIQEFYESGQVKYEGYIKDGLKEGYWKYFFEDGRVRKHGDYANGSKAYWWEEFYYNGRIKSEGMYLNGEKDEFWTYYDENGFKLWFGRFDKGKKIGVWKKYKNGELFSVIDYAN